MANPPKTMDFQRKLDDIFLRAEEMNLAAVTIKAGDFHKLLGPAGGNENRMPICCDVLYKNMQPGDEIIYAPPKGKGSRLTIRFHFPRK